MQKHCNCVNDINDQSILNCCKQGWRLAFCHSRHLDKNEQEYAPIEGDALAVCWALKKARLFLLGCPHFEVIVDHSPLLKIFGDKCLNDILNPRLFDFKEKTLPYSFAIRYIKGIKNHANTFSRYPVGEPDKDDIAASDMVNTFVQRVAAVTAEKTLSVTLESLLEASKEDEQYQELFEKVKKNTFAECMSAERPSIREFYNVKDRLSIVDNLIMYGFESGNLRLVIPKRLRHQIIVNLHSANQGSTSMLSRARQAIYWPGMDRDINNHVQSCLSCRESAPSHVREPILLADIPEFPFQNVVVNLFEIESYKYLVYADRLTGFVELAYFPSTTTSTVIINTLREFFHRWGVAEEISLDGASNLQSTEIKDWLKSWGVRVRLSSAHYHQSNGRAEVGVKSMKRLLRGNTGRKGAIDTDKVAQALLQYRNTPLRGINKSPAELALGRSLRETVPLRRQRYKIDTHWAQHLREREKVLSVSNELTKSKYDVQAREKETLVKGDNVLCQNVRTKKWDRSGVIVEVGDYRQYLVKMDGIGRISLRNRRHLQKLAPTGPNIPVTTQLATEVQPETSSFENVVSPTSTSPEFETTNIVPIANSSTNTTTEQEFRSVQQVQPEIQPRRSTRVQRTPIRFKDYQVDIK